MITELFLESFRKIVDMEKTIKDNKGLTFKKLESCRTFIKTFDELSTVAERSSRCLSVS